MDKDGDCMPFNDGRNELPLEMVVMEIFGDKPDHSARITDNLLIDCTQKC